MSSSTAQVSTQPPGLVPAEERLAFPPFPEPPLGVSIIPFSSFKERGIQMFPVQNQSQAQDTNDNANTTKKVDEDDDNEDDVGIELDGLGIPTVELRVKHDMDECKTDTRRKRRKLNAKSREGAGRGATTTKGEVKKKEWWGVWEENEDLKGGGPYDPRTPALDRFYEAAADFKRSRIWPPNPIGLSASWDQFRLYVGLLSNTPVWTRTDKPAEPGNDDDDANSDMSSDDGEKQVNPSNSKMLPRSNLRPLPRPPYALYGTDPIPVSSDDQVQSLLNSETARRESQMLTFLSSPYPLLQTFLSSYMRKQGLIWADRNLINIPRLVGFFVRFLIRNDVFRGEKAIERELKRSVEVIEKAEKELILTSRIAKQIPDDASRAFKACWGNKAEGYKPIPKDDSEAQETDRDEGRKEDQDQKADKSWGNEQTSSGGLNTASMFAGMEEIKVTDDLLNDAAKLEAIRDNLNPDIDALPTWAKSADDWGTGSTTADWGAPDVVDWGPPAIFTLFQWLGLTSLPITHTTGIVENSVRKIRSIEPPKLSTAAPALTVSGANKGKDGDGDGDENGQWKADPEQVEMDLDARFAKIVLEPWLNWDAAEVVSEAVDVDSQGRSDNGKTKKYESDVKDEGVETSYMTRPRIIFETSRGEVRGIVLAPDGSATPASASNDAKASSNAQTNQKDASLPDVTVPPHDPLTDTITLLVDSSVLPDIVPGMGLGGTWVQIARSAAYARQIKPDGQGEEKKRKGGKGKGKGKKNASGGGDAIVDGKFWYVDELMLVLTSYHR